MNLIISLRDKSYDECERMEKIGYLYTTQFVIVCISCVCIVLCVFLLCACELIYDWKETLLFVAVARYGDVKVFVLCDCSR